MKTKRIKYHEVAIRFSVREELYKDEGGYKSFAALIHDLWETMDAWPNESEDEEVEINGRLYGKEEGEDD